MHFLGLFGFEDYSNKVSTLEKPVQMMFAVAPKNYTKLAIANDADLIESKTHKGIAKHTSGEMTPIVYAEQIVPLHLLSRATLVPKQLRTVQQARFLKNEGTSKLVTITKKLYTKKHTKSFIFTDGSTSIPFGHPYLKQYIYSDRLGQPAADLLQNKRIGVEKANEKRMRKRLPWAYNAEKYFNLLLPNGETVYEHIQHLAEELS